MSFSKEFPDRREEFLAIQSSYKTSDTARRRGSWGFDIF